MKTFYRRRQEKRLRDGFQTISNRVALAEFGVSTGAVWERRRLLWPIPVRCTSQSNACALPQRRYEVATSVERERCRRLGARVYGWTAPELEADWHIDPYQIDRSVIEWRSTCGLDNIVVRFRYFVEKYYWIMSESDGRKTVWFHDRWPKNYCLQSKTALAIHFSTMSYRTKPKWHGCHCVIKWSSRYSETEVGWIETDSLLARMVSRMI